MTRLPRELLGVFVIGGLILFGVGIFLIGDRRLLFTDSYELVTGFRKISGLRVGTRVRVAGMDAGEILRIEVPSQPSEPFSIRFRVREDLRQLIRTDSVASIATDGIVGNAFVQVGPGSNAAPVAAPGTNIRGSEPVELADVLIQTTQTLDSMRQMINQVGVKVTDTLTTIDGSSERFLTAVTGVTTDVQRLTRTSERAAAELRGTMAEGRAIVASVRAGEGTIGRLITDDALYTRMANSASETQKTIESVRKTSEETRAALTTMLGDSGPVLATLRNMRDTTASVREAVSDISENTEALKRHWLFRGFFRSRGFFDVNAFEPDEYRRWSTDAKRRTALRVWIDGAQIFEQSSEGDERLTRDGRARLDLAMGTFLQHSREDPLIVEGYANPPDANQQFLRADLRARLVRDYLTGRFERRANIVGAIPLGEKAIGSPRGDGTWDGVALALHVPK